MEFLYFLLGTIFLFIFFVFIARLIDNNGDWLFLFRKSEFGKKLKRAGYKHSYELMDSLFHTDITHWKRGSSSGVMTYSPFKNTTIKYENHAYRHYFSLDRTKNIYILVGKTVVFEMSQEEEHHNVFCPTDYSQKQPISDEQAFEMRQVFVYLQRIFTEQEQIIQQQKETNKKEEQKAYIKKKRTLEHILSTQKSGFYLHSESNFQLKLDEKTPYLSFTISYQGTCYYQALYIKQSGEIETQFHHQDEEEAILFKELESTLNTYATQLFSSIQEKHHS